MEPFIGEVRSFAFNVVPHGWHLCDGTLLPISQNQALFSIIGTTYGGNGSNNFALPDLRGCVAISAGQGPGLQMYPVGVRVGTEGVALTAANGVPHGHSVGAAASAATGSAAPDNVLAESTQATYAPTGAGSTAAMGPGTIGTTGGASHANMQPSLVISYCIATTGMFPPHS